MSKWPAGRRRLPFLGKPELTCGESVWYKAGYSLWKLMYNSAARLMIKRSHFQVNSIL